MLRQCKRHGETSHRLSKTENRYRCRQCSSEAVSKRRIQIRLQLITEFGGKCIICGYDRCIGALKFHHLDPAIKEFGLSGKGLCRSLTKARAEVAKCILICGNCHDEIHAGLINYSPLAPK